MRPNSPKIRDLAIVGDRRTAALIDAGGSVLWYCPQRFDAPSVFAALLDPDAGAWRIHLQDLTFCERRYVENSAVLQTSLESAGGVLTVIDWMPISDDAPRGLLCRKFEGAPQNFRVSLTPCPDYSCRPAEIRNQNGRAIIADNLYFYASHPFVIKDNCIDLLLNKGEDGWALLSDSSLDSPTHSDIDRWLTSTLTYWRQVAARSCYEGPYKPAVEASLRAIRLLTYEPTGGIVAAATTSLPEVPGGERNYDYRYVWLRDSAMIVRALIHAERAGTSEKRFLEFIRASQRCSWRLPLAPMNTVSHQVAPRRRSLPFSGYRNSRPVLVGNHARLQLQMSAYGNVLLAAKLIYETYRTREHWELVETIADFLMGRWSEPDNGIWEEPNRRQYTVSKVMAVCGLEAIADFTKDEGKASRYRESARKIRRYVSANCMTKEGAFASVANGQHVDVSAALFPVWSYTAPDTAEMKATIAMLERDYADGDLYRRHLETFDTRREGAFLAGTFWVAHYWVLRNDLERARRILDAGLNCANDLGLFAEEQDTVNGNMLGNFPQGFVHAAFINAVSDLRAALAGGSPTGREQK